MHGLGWVTSATHKAMTVSKQRRDTIDESTHDRCHTAWLLYAPTLSVAHIVMSLG